MSCNLLQSIRPRQTDDLIIETDVWKIPDKNEETKKHVPKRKITPPLMRLAKYPTCQELEMWKQMHQNTFFNKKRIVTETDVLKSLPYAKERTRLNGMPSPYLLLKKNKVYKDRTQHEQVKYITLMENITQLDKPQPFIKGNDGSSGKDTFKPARFHPFPVPPPQKLCFKQLQEPKTSRPLLRRPLVPVWEPLTEPTARSSSSAELDQFINDIDLEYWRRSSLTTVFKDDPLDPNNFYNHHYPLLLKKVPKRFKEGSSEGYDEMYRPMCKTPEIDMRFFYMLAHCSLSDEIITGK